MKHGDWDKYLSGGRRPCSRASLRLNLTQRRMAEAELEIFLAAMSHDHQFALFAAVRLFRLLEAPRGLTTLECVRLVYDALAVHRSRSGFGRPWTFRQLRRLVGADPASFRRVAPAPVTDEEIAEYRPSGAAAPGPFAKGAIRVARALGDLRGT